MNKILKNILAVIIGWLLGSVVNIGLINLGHSIFPVEGVDPNDMEQMKIIMPTLGFKYFIFPFLAHALGTLVGAFTAYLIAANNKMKFALGIGGLFFLGGLAVNSMITGPTWFTITDLALAYFPMAYIGGKLANKI
ncbi:MAG: hypothetical protein BM564_05110 [Bacteroidetes bacterium MedPE-SWsnd-G2]|nr:MAG: hypothetical protein BM564_05110 [Bacteroidetes bacterium MedPE-SWsnd-G2]